MTRAALSSLLLALAACAEESAESAEAGCLLPGCPRTCWDAEACEPGEACLIGAIDDGRVMGLCGPEPGAGELGDPCSDDAECRGGLCLSTCTELCAACQVGATCQREAFERLGEALEAGVCRWDLAAPVVDLGPLEIPAAGLELDFQLVEPMASLTLVAWMETELDTRRVGITRLEAPDGARLVDDSAEVVPNPASIRYPDATAVMVPVSDAVEPPSAGLWRASLGVFDTDYQTWTPIAERVERVTVHLEPPGEEGGMLDLEIFLAPATGITAAEAADNAWIRTFLDEVAGYYAPADVRLGLVRFHDLDASANAMADSDAIRDLCEAHSLRGPQGVSVNLFIVGSIGFADGFTSGTPGPPGIAGTMASGVVVQRHGSAARTARTAAHEIGHYLGLMHTTVLNVVGGKLTVAGEDPISDTPSCQPGTALEQCPDYRNLMFPRYPVDGQASLSAGQIEVLRRNPLLWERDRPHLCEAKGHAYDLTGVGWATGCTVATGDALAGSCGGEGAPERVQVLRPGDAQRVTVRVTGRDFAPAAYVRRGCEAGAEELACGSAAVGEELVLDVDVSDVSDSGGDAAPGPLFIVVDGSEPDSGGRFVVTVESVSTD